MRQWHGSTVCPLLFDGQYADGESGWAYNRFRYYSPDLGIYGAQDPLGLSPNLGWAQGYVSHPGCMVDVLGLMAHSKIGAWERTEVLGKNVYKSEVGHLFDPHLVTGGENNIQRMQRGIAPIGHDGKSIQLHHIGQSNDSALVELTRTLHKGNHHQLHIYSGMKASKFPSDVVPVNRLAFNKWRDAYWRERALDFQ